MQLTDISEECGVFAIHNHNNAGLKCLLGLHALQHRGQESCGIVTSGSDGFRVHHFSGHVNHIFGQSDKLNFLTGTLSIGHVRYSTSGGKTAAQPLILDCKFGELAIAHNGNLTNAHGLREDLIRRGSVFLSDVDTEVIAHLVAVEPKPSFIDNIISAVKQVKGAYSLVLMTGNTIVGLRDPAGIRPLVLGITDGAYVMASETCALDIVGAKFIRNIKPGELVVIDGTGDPISVFPFQPLKHNFCIFEYVYFARPDSIVENIPVYEVRKKIGMELALESPPPPDVDMVVPVPDSGVPAAMGYATKTNLPFELGIIRNHYTGRTFIQPTDEVRKLGVELKHNANSSLLRGKNVVLVDDSIVRGTTLKGVIEMLRRSGTQGIHLRISSPPTLHPCFYGIDTPDKAKLVANGLSLPELTRMLKCDSLAFLSVDGLYRAVCNTKRNNKAPQYCDACFTGHYPVGQPNDADDPYT